MVVLNQAHERHDEPPCYHDGGQPATRAELLEEQVGGDFERRVGEEEDGEAPVVLVWLYAEIDTEAFDVCIANVSTCASQLQLRVWCERTLTVKK